jgi:hypothetical protein
MSEKVGKDHIDLLVTAAIALAPVTNPPEDADRAWAKEIGEELIDQNFYAVNGRPGRKEEYTWEPVPEFMNEKEELDPWVCLQTLAAIKYYEKQSHGQPHWLRSRPHWLMSQLRSSMGAVLEYENWPITMQTKEWAGVELCHPDKEWTRAAGFREGWT